MIQILTYSGEENELQGKDIEVNRIHDAKSLDEFDINIIILEDEKIWRYNGINSKSVDDFNDLKSLSIMIKRSIISKNIILIPQNKLYFFDPNYLEERYEKFIELKDMLEDFCSIIAVFSENILFQEIVYENTKTTINGEEIKASFYFENPDNTLLVSDKSKKATTISLDKIIFSTLYLKNYDQIINFLKKIDLLGS